MSEYRRKAGAVEAVQWEGFGASSADLGIRPFGPGSGAGLGSIETPDGHLLVAPGDWIISTTNGRYPLSPGLFEATYELATVEST